MQYWINHNGVQSGPVDVDGIKEMGLTSAAYVWHEGLTDWVKITQLPELQGMYEMLEPVAEPAVWAIITTVLCCIPSGIVAIFYALKVSNKYREGDIEGAKRASETGAWWCIASIILGIIAMPLSYLMMMAGAS